MDYQATETIILNEKEFVLMLAAAGVRDWYGIDIGKNTDFMGDTAEVNQHLADLYRKELIDWGSEKARISDSARPVMNILRHAAVCIMCESRAMPGLIVGSYCSDGNVVMIERSIGGKDELMLTYMSKEEWFDYFDRGGFLPKVADISEDIDPANLIPEEGDLISEFEVRSIPEGHLLENLMLFDCGVHGMIIDNSTNTSVRKMYSPDRIRTIMYSWAGGMKE